MKKIIFDLKVWDREEFPYPFEKALIKVNGKFIEEIDKEPITNKVKFISTTPNQKEAMICNETDLYNIVCFFDREIEKTNIEIYKIEGE